jgi:hypothetical protein
MAAVNTLAYYDTATITELICFIEQTPGSCTLQVPNERKRDTLHSKLMSLLLSVTLTGSDKHSSLPHNLLIFCTVRIRNALKRTVLNKVFQPLLFQYHNRLECLSLPFIILEGKTGILHIKWIPLLDSTQRAGSGFVRIY